MIMNEHEAPRQIESPVISPRQAQITIVSPSRVCMPSTAQ